jgi:hypothetical protein
MWDNFMGAVGFSKSLYYNRIKLCRRYFYYKLGSHNCVGGIYIIYWAHTTV